MRRRRGIMGLNGGAGIPIITATATGNPLTFETDLVRQLKSLVIPFTPIQSGSGDPSPDNVRPISGWTGANIYNVSGNVFNPSDVTITPNKSIGITGTISDNNYHDITSEIEVSSGDVFIFSNSVNNNAPSVVLRVCCYNANMTFQTYRDISAENTGAWSGEVTIPEGVKYIRLSIVKTYKQTPSPFLTMQMQKKQTLPINWQDEAGTIYGGTLTLNEDGSADLVSEYGYQSLNGTENWAWSVTAQTGAINANLNIPAMKSLGNSPLGKASYAKNNSGDSGTLCIRFGWNNRQIYLFNPQNYLDGVTDLASFKMYLAENPLQISFPLATSATYHFDNVGHLITFVGTNNIWTDTNGTNTATYLKHQS